MYAPVNGTPQPGTLLAGNSVNEQIGSSMARKRYQLGSVKLRGSSWEFRWREDVLMEGQVRRKTCRFAFAGTKDYPTRRAALRDPWVVGKLNELNSLNYRPSTVLTFEQFATRWNAEVAIQMEPSSQASDRSRLGIINPKKIRANADRRGIAGVQAPGHQHVTCVSPQAADQSQRERSGQQSDRNTGRLKTKSVNAGEQAEYLREAETKTPCPESPQSADNISVGCKLVTRHSSLATRKLPTLLSLIGTVQLKDIDVRIVQLVVRRLTEAGASGKTVKNYIATLRTLWKTARAWNYVTHDPFTGIVLPDATPREVPFYERSKIAAIIQSSEEPYSTLWWVVSETGIRRSEICALRVCDVALYLGAEPLDQGVVIVRRKVWGNIVGPTKSKKPRVFSLSPALTEHLREFLGDADPDRLVFRNSNGGMLHPDNLVKRHLKPVVNALGLKGGMHAFRHGNATMMDQLNIPMAVRQGRLGHVNPKTTMGYTHLVTEDDRRAAAKLGSMIAPERVM
jgi:integrase